MHSLTGDYSNAKEAIEDVLVLVNANTKALIHLANSLTELSKRINGLKCEITNQDNKKGY